MTIQAAQFMIMRLYDALSEENKRVLDIAIDAMDKQKPKAVRDIIHDSFIYGYCPSCETYLCDNEGYCPDCGQALRWEGEDD